jgi:hypothetical protein
MSEVAVLTPIRDGEADGLRVLLRGLSPADSPFAGLGVTHFARLVVIDAGRPGLLLTSRFDGDRKKYLERFVQAPRTCEIYSRCAAPERGDPDVLDPETLLGYLLYHRPHHIPASYVVSAFPDDATVLRINAALELRNCLSSFALDNRDAIAVELAQRFREQKKFRELAEP